MTEVTKKIHKSHREKQKRDHLNEGFLKLERTLEQARQNNGKASILSDATKILRDLIFQVESLIKENADLIAETRYVTAERDELKDETSTLGSEVDKLKNELRERGRADSSWNNDTDNVAASVPPVHQATAESHSYLGRPRIGASSVSNPPYVTRPRARYPNSSASWPQQPLLQHLIATFGTQSSNSGTSTTTCNTTADCREMEGSSSPRELQLL